MPPKSRGGRLICVCAVAIVALTVIWKFYHDSKVSRIGESIAKIVVDVDADALKDWDKEMFSGPSGLLTHRLPAEVRLSESQVQDVAKGLVDGKPSSIGERWRTDLVKVTVVFKDGSMRVLRGSPCLVLWAIGMDDLNASMDNFSCESTCERYVFSGVGSCIAERLKEVFGTIPR
jgi:hypothetical protein